MKFLLFRVPKTVRLNEVNLTWINVLKIVEYKRMKSPCRMQASQSDKRIKPLSSASLFLQRGARNQRQFGWRRVTLVVLIWHSPAVRKKRTIVCNAPQHLTFSSFCPNLSGYHCSEVINTVNTRFLVFLIGERKQRKSNSHYSENFGKSYRFS